MIKNNKDEVIETFNQAIQQAFDVPTIYKKEGSNRYIPIRLKDHFTLNSDGDNEHIFIKSLNATDEQKLSTIEILIKFKWKMLRLSSPIQILSYKSQENQETYIEFNFNKSELLKILKKIDSEFSFDLELDNLKEIQIDHLGLVTEDKPSKNDTDFVVRNRDLDHQEIKIQNKKLKAEILEKDRKIKELESLSKKSETDLISLIFDETATDRYAPDLVSAIKLWEQVYINSSNDDSHTNKANYWIQKNTGYNESDNGGRVAIDRIREITTPFKDWGHKRNKKIK